MCDLIVSKILPSISVILVPYFERSPPLKCSKKPKIFRACGALNFLLYLFFLNILDVLLISFKNISTFPMCDLIRGGDSRGGGDPVIWLDRRIRKVKVNLFQNIIKKMSKKLEKKLS